MVKNKKSIRKNKEVNNSIKKIKDLEQKIKENPDVINASRKKRIAKGCGRPVTEVNRLLKQFEDTKKIMKQMSGMQQKGKKRGGFNLPFKLF